MKDWEMQSPQTAVKERPILFSGAMVRAILEGRKTQTRRVIKPQPSDNIIFEWSKGKGHLLSSLDRVNFLDLMAAHCPYGQPGDRLWVREAWRVPKGQDNRDAATMARLARQAGYDAPWAPIQFEADQRRVDWDDVEIWGREAGRYRHARFMPRWASRILLEIVNVRVERLQSISISDAISEGVKPFYEVDLTSVDVFAELWDDINGAGSWDANPFVWCITFRRVS